MMRKIYTLLLLAACSFSAASAQTVSINDNPTGTSANIVLGTLNYHVSEYLYRAAELGTNFTASPINKVGFSVSTVGATPTFGSVNIYMQNVATSTDVLATGTYSTEGYTLVYSGSVSMANAGFNTIDLTTSFLRTAGSNLLVLIERTDNATHTGFVFVPSLDDPSGAAATPTSRRYNGTVAPSGTTSLAASTFRAAIQLTSSLPDDASVTAINYPNISCYSTPQNISVVLTNNGTSAIAAGAASVALHLGAPNAFIGSLPNAAAIAPGASETITFSNLNINNAGISDDTAIVTYPLDGDASNDTTFGSLIVSTTFNVDVDSSALEGAETDLPVFSWLTQVEGDPGRVLWRLQQTPPSYINADLPDSLPAYEGSNFYLFDSYSGASSAGIVSRLYSNCITLRPPLTTACSASISFWMSHDNIFNTDLDSLYISVSTDKGATWNRLTGFGRVDAAFNAAPGWRQEIVDLSSYIGQTIQVGFEGVSNYGDVIGLDDIRITSNCVAPVNLLSFTAQKVNKANKLTWKTSHESNSKKFVIEQSKDGRNFTALAEVAAAGNSNTERTYNFTHNLPTKGNNYYRIRMVDLDNSFKYSPVRNLQNLGLNEITSNPNPVRDNMIVGINTEKAGIANIIITDMNGQTVYTKASTIVEGDNTFNINTANFTAGHYIVKIQMNDEVVVKKFIKM